MKSALALCALVAAACLAGTAAGAVRANSATFADPAGDSGNAPDITAVSVSNDDAGTVTFLVTIANRPVLGPQDMLVLAMDIDGNASNGVSGIDYAAAMGPGFAMLVSGAGGTFVPAAVPSFSGSYQGGVATFAVNRSDIGNPSTIVFFLQSSADGGDTAGDDAPDGTAIWRYQPIIAAAPVAPPAAVKTPRPPTTPKCHKGQKSTKAHRCHK